MVLLPIFTVFFSKSVHRTAKLYVEQKIYSHLFLHKFISMSFYSEYYVFVQMRPKVVDSFSLIRKNALCPYIAINNSETTNFS